MRDDSNTDGGPAFPMEWNNETGKEVVVGGVAIPHGDRATVLGLSVRDYFAAKAMQTALAICANDAREEGMSYFEHVSGVSYAMADAMLKARRQ